MPSLRPLTSSVLHLFQPLMLTLNNISAIGMSGLSAGGSVEDFFEVFFPS